MKPHLFEEFLAMVEVRSIIGCFLPWPRRAEHAPSHQVPYEQQKQKSQTKAYSHVHLPYPPINGSHGSHGPKSLWKRWLDASHEGGWKGMSEPKHRTATPEIDKILLAA